MRQCFAALAAVVLRQGLRQSCGSFAAGVSGTVLRQMLCDRGSGSFAASVCGGFAARVSGGFAAAAGFAASVMRQCFAAGC